MLLSCLFYGGNRDRGVIRYQACGLGGAEVIGV